MGEKDVGRRTRVWETGEKEKREKKRRRMTTGRERGEEKMEVGAEKSRAKKLFGDTSGGGEKGVQVSGGAGKVETMRTKQPLQEK